MVSNGANSSPASDRPEGRHGSIRRHAFVTVLVLVTVFPLAIFALTYWLNKASARRMLDERLLRSIRNAAGLKGDVERSLAMAEALGYVNVLPDHGPMPDGTTKILYKTYVTPAFKKTLEEIQPRDEMLDFATLLDARGEVIAWFRERGKQPRQGDIQVKPHDTHHMLLYKITQAASRNHRPVITMAFPTRIGKQIAGTLVIGLSFDRINQQIHNEMGENNRRALSISVAGSVLLAALGGYLLKLNDKARMLQSALEKRRHLAYVGTISAGLAHEIRNPLSSVKMNVHMLRNRLEGLDIEDKESLLRKIDRVSSEADRLEKSVGDFLVLAAPRPLHKQLSDVSAAVDSVVDFLGKAQEGVEVVKRHASALPRVEIDQDMFVQMLQNLVINALQAAGDGGRVEVETFAEKNEVGIAVSDSGPGVAEDEREKIFEVFYTTKRGGTGLGLNIAKRIAEEHGGGIALEESSLGGARFVVRLPLSNKG